MWPACLVRAGLETVLVVAGPPYHLLTTRPRYQPEKDRFITTAREAYTPRGEETRASGDQRRDAARRKHAQQARIVRRQLHTAREAATARDAMQRQALMESQRIFAKQRQRELYTRQVRRNEREYRAASQDAAGGSPSARSPQNAPSTVTPRAAHHLASTLTFG